MSAGLNVSSIKKVIDRPTITRQTMLTLLILVSIFIIAIILRVFPAKYGFFLNEFDPYFDYRAADFIVERIQSNGLAGIGEYFRWTDFGSWYPEGREVAKTSQTGLQFTAVFLFLIASALGSSIQLYDMVVLFPVFAGGLLAIVTFLLAKKIGGHTAGFLAALAVSVAPPLIQRGGLGWFKSEPLALLLTITASYVFLTLFDSRISLKGTMLRGLLAGALLGFANTAWGGAQFFVIVFGLLFIISPFLKVDLQKVVYGGALLVAGDLLMGSIFPRPGPSFIFSVGGLALLGSYLFAYIGYRVKMYSNSEKEFYKTMVKVIFTLGLLVMVVLSLNVIPGLSGRYNTAVNPFLISGNPLVESVAEHKSPTGATSFLQMALLSF
ncbi:MAG: STT3 domain-containing protein [Nitrososphaerales archaeon]